MKTEDLWKMTLKSGERVGLWQDRKDGRYMEIIVNDDGSIRVRCHDGFISVEPEVSNSVVIRHRKWELQEVS